MIAGFILGLAKLVKLCLVMPRFRDAPPNRPRNKLEIQLPRMNESARCERCLITILGAFRSHLSLQSRNIRQARMISSDQSSALSLSREAYFSADELIRTATSNQSRLTP
ncbi:uncharacterized protein CIMG_11156 [Coccidioides immitis RS]|uniref:Uncharacterized protein n=4 Tax=Coccidioides immitis TaxID=5501 RepID=J3KBR1_COCIM|nr:uncharacterized protein CIMG_11156 [Coccidioides immitis RS]EAS32579.3 hypothetical protein CIMG_11156 [Coccidioides immitis RS]KMP07822.1 hypothetical protein CIRG_07503 [Coccidioides immitis RMSCC 2394]KMU71717.1 hypothetical protein CISG_00027 [Coccidioides immitis RMSCC 3703]KMU85004.1 hypothetical protein CIHG_02787 [Coccidioides immitis H538.4]